VSGVLRALAIGAAAGAAGSTALNAVTYLDMAVRGRPASGTPGQTVQRLSEVTHLPVPGEGESRENRVAGLGPLAGLITGVGSGVLLALARAAGWRPGLVTEAGVAAGLALLGSNGPMTALGVTDPRTWPASSWVSDVVPHLAYGAVAAGVLRGLAGD
jgi:hypothetical protein